jgi:aminopeptidase N
VLPTRYDLRLEPDLERFTFEGQVVIDVGVSESVDQIVLNAAEIELKEATLRGAGG